MKHAPPIIGRHEFAGLKNALILIEHDPEDESLILISKAIDGDVNIIYSSDIDFGYSGFNSDFTVATKVDSVYRIQKAIKSVELDLNYHIIHRLDMMDSKLGPRERGAQQAAFMSMIAQSKILRDSNLIVTSVRHEYKLRERADVFLNLRK